MKLRIVNNTDWGLYPGQSLAPITDELNNAPAIGPHTQWESVNDVSRGTHPLVGGGTHDGQIQWKCGAMVDPSRSSENWGNTGDTRVFYHFVPDSNSVITYNKCYIRFAPDYGPILWTGSIEEGTTSDGVTKSQDFTWVWTTSYVPPRT